MFVTIYNYSVSILVEPLFNSKCILDQQVSKLIVFLCLLPVGSCIVYHLLNLLKVLTLTKHVLLLTTTSPVETCTDHSLFICVDKLLAAGNLLSY